MFGKRATGAIVVENPRATRLEQRLARMSEHSLYEWAGNSLNSIGLALESGEDYALDEAEKGAEQLLAVVRAMKGRRA